MDGTRYRDAERRLWEDVGLVPRAHRLRLDRNGVDVRVQEVGDGPPVLFVHGGPGTSGAVFARLAAELPHLRCLLLDRPGTGESDAHHLADPVAVRAEAETLVVDVLDALGLDRAHLVGSSHGSYVAIHSAATHPSRVDRTVHLGCPGFVEGMALTSFDRLVLLRGAWRVIGWLPSSQRSTLATMRQLGHGASVDAGRFSPAFLDWSVAVLRDTPTMANELRSMANMGAFRHGFDPRLTITPEVLARVASPTYLLWGEGDPYGDADVARGVADGLPDAQLELLPGAGHLCWFDDVRRAAEAITSHLAARTVPGLAG